MLAAGLVVCLLRCQLITPGWDRRCEVACLPGLVAAGSLRGALGPAVGLLRLGGASHEPGAHAAVPVGDTGAAGRLGLGPPAASLVGCAHVLPCSAFACHGADGACIWEGKLWFALAGELGGTALGVAGAVMLASGAESDTKVSAAGDAAALLGAAANGASLSIGRHLLLAPNDLPVWVSFL